MTETLYLAQSDQNSEALNFSRITNSAPECQLSPSPSTIATTRAVQKSVPGVRVGEYHSARWSAVQKTRERSAEAARLYQAVHRVCVGEEREWYRRSGRRGGGSRSRPPAAYLSPGHRIVGCIPVPGYRTSHGRSFARQSRAARMTVHGGGRMSVPHIA
eukprot:3102458-Rhodomonas_salina.1